MVMFVEPTPWQLALIAFARQAFAEIDAEVATLGVAEWRRRRAKQSCAALNAKP